MDDPLEVQLLSRTVFWRDLGLGSSPRVTFSLRQQPEERRRISSAFWDEHVEPWLQKAILHDYHVHDAGIWFAHGREALLFLSRWGGRIPM